MLAFWTLSNHIGRCHIRWRGRFVALANLKGRFADHSHRFSRSHVFGTSRAKLGRRYASNSQLQVTAKRCRLTRLSTVSLESDDVEIRIAVFDYRAGCRRDGFRSGGRDGIHRSQDSVCCVSGSGSCFAGARPQCQSLRTGIGGSPANDVISDRIVTARHWLPSGTWGGCLPVAIDVVRGRQQGRMGLVSNPLEASSDAKTADSLPSKTFADQRQSCRREVKKQKRGGSDEPSA